MLEGLIGLKLRTSYFDIMLNYMKQLSNYL